MSKNLQIAAAVLLLLWVPSLLAQSAGTGALTGTVTDPTGAVVPNVTVTLTSSDTNQARTANTGADGTYKFGLLPPGTYRIRFAAPGFKTSEIGGVTINVTETPTLDRALEVGQQSEQVTVEASVETVQTASSTLGTVVGSRAVTALPLSTRNYTQILGLSAGVSGSVNNATSLGKGTVDASVNGANVNQNNYQMDGVNVAELRRHRRRGRMRGIYAGIGIPNPDALQEFKIQTSTYDASYGRNPGANVNVVTKSGTNSDARLAVRVLPQHGSQRDRLFPQPLLRTAHQRRRLRRPRRRCETGSEPESVRRIRRHAHQEGQNVLLLQLSGNPPGERRGLRRAIPANLRCPACPAATVRIGRLQCARQLWCPAYHLRDARPHERRGQHSGRL